MIVDIFPISRTSLNRYRKKLGFKKLYEIFSNDNFTTREKRDHLQKLDIPQSIKDNMWNAYMGDNLNHYIDIPEYDYESEEE